MCCLFQGKKSFIKSRPLLGYCDLLFSLKWTRSTEGNNLYMFITSLSISLVLEETVFLKDEALKYLTLNNQKAYCTKYFWSWVIQGKKPVNFLFSIKHKSLYKCFQLNYIDYFFKRYNACILSALNYLLSALFLIVMLASGVLRH